MTKVTAEKVNCSSRTPPAHGGALPPPTTANGLNPSSDEAFVQDCMLPTRRLWLIWSKMLMTICLTVFCTITNIVLNRILPTKTESTEKKRSERDANTARAGCRKVRTPPARPPTHPSSAHHRQDRLQCTAPLCLARSVIINLDLGVTIDHWP